MQRCTHSSVVSVGAWYGWLPESRERWVPERGATWHFLFGVTEESDEALMELGRSWLYPAEIEAVGGATFVTYDLGQMAHVFEITGECVEFRLVPDGVTRNPLFLLRHWRGAEDVQVEFDGRPVPREKLRTGREGTSLYLWVEERLDAPCNVAIRHGWAVE